MAFIDIYATHLHHDNYEVRFLLLGGISIDKKGHIFITPRLSTEGEIDYYVDMRIRELEKARVTGKRALKRKRRKPLSPPC
ncbi:hypothetical protein ACFL43_04010 [Thermodesulfobacteriota bacterium]